MAESFYDRYLIVTDDLMSTATFLGQTMVSPKGLKEMFKNQNKASFRWGDKLDIILERLIKDAENKNAIFLTEEYLDTGAWQPNLPSKVGIMEGMNQKLAAEQYQKTKAHILQVQKGILPLYEVIKPHLRTTVIQHFFHHTILPSITKEMMENADRSNSLTHVKYSWSFIASFKKKLLGDYAGKELYWTRLVYSKDAEKLLLENIGDTRKVAKTKDLRVFYPSTWNKRNYENGLEYIDVFTTDSSIGHFLLLTADRKTVAFSTDLTPLVKNLEELDLLNL